MGYRVGCRAVTGRSLDCKFLSSVFRGIDRSALSVFALSHSQSFLWLYRTKLLGEFHSSLVVALLGGELGLIFRPSLDASGVGLSGMLALSLSFPYLTTPSESRPSDRLNLPLGAVAAALLFFFLNLNPHRAMTFKDFLRKFDFIGM